MTCTIFVGPSAHGIDLDFLCDERITVKAPVRRGDIEQLLMSGTVPDTIIIVDGTFHSYPSVGHAEIRSALERGCDVWGLSSMGALRAAEMSKLGVHGFGRVYAKYAADPDFDDDEVALLHGIEPPFLPISEPLIHIRALISDAVSRNVIIADRGVRVISHLKNMWYGDRTLKRLQIVLESIGGIDPALAAEEVSRIDEFRLKTIDLVDFLTVNPWLEHRIGCDG